MSADSWEPAFPVSWKEYRGSDVTEIVKLGMTVREYFAAHAPSRPSWYCAPVYGQFYQQEDLMRLEVQWRYEYADRMLEARK